MNMVWHDDERVQQKPSLSPIVLQRLHHQLRVLFDLEYASPSRCRKSSEIRAQLLRGPGHPVKDTPESPGLKPPRWRVPITARQKRAATPGRRLGKRESMAGMAHVALIICAIVFAVLWVSNAAVMLVSPKTWLQLPSWTGVHGTMTQRKYDNSWGRLQVRLLGAIFLTVSLGIIYDVVSN